MARKTQRDRLLAANVRAIQKAVKATSGRASEYRIEGARGLVLHVLSSGTATWYFHYDAEIGKLRERRKLKIGRLDEVTLAQALGEAERLRPLIRQGADPVSQKAANREALTFATIRVILSAPVLCVTTGTCSAKMCCQLLAKSQPTPSHATM